MPDDVALTPEKINAVLQQRYATLREARKRFAHTALAEELDANDRYVVVRSGVKRFAFPLTQVSEVLPLGERQDGTPVPGAPSTFWGLLLVRGEVRPVFDIKQLLGVSSEETGASEHILFVRDGEKDTVVGFTTERVERIETISEPERREDGSESARPGQFIRRLYHESLEAAPIQIVDVSALLASLRGEASTEPASSEREESHVTTDETASAGVEEE